MPTQVYVQRIDTTGLQEAVKEAMRYSGRTPQVAVATGGFYIARKASRDAHRASISDIDSKLGVSSEVMLVRRKGSPRFGLPYKNNKLRIVIPAIGSQPFISRAMAIILARMQAGSNVNKLENNRYVIDQAAFSPGGGKKGFIAALTAAARDMVAARHSSIAFIASAMIPMIRYLETQVAPKYRRGMPQNDPQVLQSYKRSDTDKGRAVIEVNGASATMTGEALIGVPPSNPANLNEEHNAAMIRWLAPAIQGAVYDEQCRSLMYAATQGEMEARRAKFASSGVVVT